MTQPLISVIVPVYNAEKYIERCIESIVNQTLTNIELILVNDGSTDASGRICDEYAQNDDRITVLHKQNEGVSEARNSALKIVKGRYIHCVDADDWLEINTYEKLDKVIAYNTDCDIIRFNARNSAGTNINVLPFRGEYKKADLDQIVLDFIGSPKFGGMFILGVPWLYLIKRKLIDTNQIRFDRNLRRCEDRLFIITSFLYSNKAVFVDEVLYHYETNAGSLSNKYDPFRWQQEKLFLDELKKQYHFIKTSKFVIEADARINTEYLLRAIIAINNEFFSDNTNSFIQRYSKTRMILNDAFVRKASKGVVHEALNLKQKLILFCVKYNQPLSLSIFNTILLYKKTKTTTTTQLW